MPLFPKVLGAKFIPPSWLTFSPSTLWAFREGPLKMYSTVTRRVTWWLELVAEGQLFLWASVGSQPHGPPREGQDPGPQLSKGSGWLWGLRQHGGAHLFTCLCQPLASGEEGTATLPLGHLRRPQQLLYQVS